MNNKEASGYFAFVIMMVSIILLMIINLWIEPNEFFFGNKSIFQNNMFCLLVIGAIGSFSFSVKHYMLEIEAPSEVVKPKVKITQIFIFLFGMWGTKCLIDKQNGIWRNLIFALITTVFWSLFMIIIYKFKTRNNNK